MATTDEDAFHDLAYTFVISQDVNLPVCAFKYETCCKHTKTPFIILITQITVSIQRLYGHFYPTASQNTSQPSHRLSVYCQVTLSSHGQPVGIPLLTPYGHQDDHGAHFDSCSLAFAAKVHSRSIPLLLTPASDTPKTSVTHSTVTLHQVASLPSLSTPLPTMAGRHGSSVAPLCPCLAARGD